MDPLLETIATLALHPTAEPGEWKNAAVKFFLLLRRDGVVSLPGMTVRRDAPPPPKAEPEPPRPAPRPGVQTPHRPAKVEPCIIWFGKFKGLTAAEIVAKDYRYAEWVLANCSNCKGRMRDELLEELDRHYAKK